MASAVAEAVARSLGLRSDQGQAVVQLLVEHLHSQVLPTRAVTVPELGLFYRDGSRLGFRADAALNQAAGASAAPPDPLIFEYAEEGARNWLKPVLVVLCVVLVGAGVYWGVTQWRSVPEVAGLVIPGDSIPTEPVGVAMQDTVAELTVAEESAAAQPPAAETAATAVQLAAGGSFTLVVASLPNDAAARAEADQFRSRLAPWPVEVVESDNRFRVTVGRAETMEDILELRAQLSGLPEGNWILELE
ncbi:MAG: SPOR domain-containing protein [Bacteroidota bacterium]|nr:SPOR domain-containing protein [Bacteroidota bacterium]MDE2835526.1 SPOR domain-containing protein [Bacteroidota bacterium]MDE2957001.1 SPOR domain-containing protein [Bacteroidota bacterium]